MASTGEASANLGSACTQIGESMRKFRGAAVATAAVAMTLGTAGAALAYDGSATVSCDTSITSSLVTLSSSGTISVRQNSTSEHNNRYYYAVSSTGNALSSKATVDGGTVSWTNVASSNYTYKTRIVSNQNCNGILPGNGNSSLSYTVTP